MSDGTKAYDSIRKKTGDLEDIGKDFKDAIDKKVEDVKKKKYDHTSPVIASQMFHEGEKFMSAVNGIRGVTDVFKTFLSALKQNVMNKNDIARSKINDHIMLHASAFLSQPMYND